MPDFKMTYDPSVAIPTLVGSALSCFATSCVLLAWMCYGQGKRSFRYALVLNLTFAGTPDSKILPVVITLTSAHRMGQYSEQHDIRHDCGSKQRLLATRRSVHTQWMGGPIVCPGRSLHPIGTET